MITDAPQFLFSASFQAEHECGEKNEDIEFGQCEAEAIILDTMRMFYEKVFCATGKKVSNTPEKEVKNYCSCTYLYSQKHRK